MEVFNFRGMYACMKRLHSKPTIALLLGGYFLTVTVGGAFHTHVRHDCGQQPSAPADVHAPVACCEGNSYRPSNCLLTQSKLPAFDTAGRAADTHCPICSFLSQKPVPAAIFSVERSAELGQPLVRVRAIAPLDDIPTTVFGRGPPRIA